MKRERILVTVLRAVMTAVLLGCFAVRVARAAADWAEVAHYYQFDSGFIWFPVFAAPFFVIIAAAVSLWLRWDRTFLLALICLGVSGLLVLHEGFTIFARSMNANSGYVGAEPLLSVVVCAVSGVSALLSRPKP